jgi:hypothetical protein
MFVNLLLFAERRVERRGMNVNYGGCYTNLKVHIIWRELIALSL